MFKILCLSLLYLYSNVYGFDKVKFFFITQSQPLKEIRAYETVKNIRVKFELISNISQLESLEAKNSSLKIMLAQKNLELKKYEQYKVLKEYFDDQKLVHKHEPADVIYMSVNANYMVLQTFLPSVVVEKNQLVVSKDGMLIGKISLVKAYKDTPVVKAILMTNPLFHIPVKSSKSNVHGVVRGLGFNKNLEMHCFENNCAELEIGESIVTSGEELNSPKDVFVGIVGGKTENDAIVSISHKNQRIDVASILRNEKISDW